MPSKAIKMDDITYERLKSLGAVQQRSPHWLMNEAIRQFLDREEEAEHIRQDTLDRWARYEATSESVPHDVVETWLKTWGTENEGKCPVNVA